MFNTFLCWALELRTWSSWRLRSFAIARVHSGRRDTQHAEFNGRSGTYVALTLCRKAVLLRTSRASVPNLVELCRALFARVTANFAAGPPPTSQLGALQTWRSYPGT